MKFAREGYKSYYWEYLFKRKLENFIPLLPERSNIEDCKIITLHIWDNYEQLFTGTTRFLPMIASTMKALQSTFKFNRHGVHRFVIMDKKIFLDHHYQGVGESKIFDRCVYINPVGLSPYALNRIGMLIIRLGGYVLKENFPYTETIAHKAEQSLLEGSHYKESITIESLLEEYKQFYGRDFKIKDK